MNTAKKNKIYHDIQHAEEILAKPATEDSENIQTRWKKYIWVDEATKSMGGPEPRSGSIFRDKSNSWMIRKKGDNSKNVKPHVKYVYYWWQTGFAYSED